MNQHDELLNQVGEEIFESLAFMLVMPGIDDEDAPPPAPEARIAAQVEFSGPFDGSVAVVLQRDMLVELATNMLGMDEDQPPGPEAQTDALKELLNVICGNLLPKLAGAEAVFDVHPPELLDSGQLPDRWRDQGPAGRCELPLDTGSAELAIYLAADAAVAGD